MNRFGVLVAVWTVIVAAFGVQLAAPSYRRWRRHRKTHAQIRLIRGESQ